jgi:RNA polymerase-binding transcription factor DksA
MSSAASGPIPAPLTGAQRMMLRDLLHALWRDHVVEITDLAVRFHAHEDGDLAADLAKVRRSLVDVESALDRLDSRSYGRCDACERRIPFEQLEANPAGRYCYRCQSPSSGSATKTGISRPARS